MKKMLGIFDTRLLIWFHYVLLIGILFLAHYVGNLYYNLDQQGYLFMAIWYYVWISIGDQIIHSKYILNVD